MSIHCIAQREAVTGQLLPEAISCFFVLSAHQKERRPLEAHDLKSFKPMLFLLSLEGQYVITALYYNSV